MIKTPDQVIAELTSDSRTNPIDSFQAWFQDAQAVEDARLVDAATLATVSPAGRPSARIILLKGVSERGFVFFTNYESRKAHELESSGLAALVFFWPRLLRQVRVEGRVERVSAEASDVYFQTRPRGSQIGAWASPQSRPISGRDELEKKVAEIEKKYAQGDVPCPPFWGGYQLVPQRVEFWVGRESRLHDRVVFDRTSDLASDKTEWKITRLAP